MPQTVPAQCGWGYGWNWPRFCLTEWAVVRQKGCVLAAQRLSQKGVVGWAQRVRRSAALAPKRGWEIQDDANWWGENGDLTEAVGQAILENSLVCPQQTTMVRR